MKTFRIYLVAILAFGTAQAAVPVVTNVVAQQRVSTKLVDINYDVFDDDGDTLKIRVEISDNGGNLYSVPAFSFTGDIGDGVVTGANKHIVWDAGTDWDGEYSDEMRVKVIAVDAQGLPGLEWGSEVPPGGFLLGQDGGAEGSGPSRHVNIPWSYWLSKYEIRNDQYAEYLNTAIVAGHVRRVSTTGVEVQGNQYTGSPDGSFMLNIGDGVDIRWNVNNFEVVDGRSNFPVRVTWHGANAFAQHYGYDLPTDAEWEKAARGPDHDDEDEHQRFPWGDSIEDGFANSYSSEDPWDNGPTPVGYYDGNQVPFGPDRGNAYGLYDMIGNVSELTRSQKLDLASYPQEESLLNPRHLLTDGNYKVVRGGNYGDYRTSDYLQTRYRRSHSLGQFDAEVGFRVIRRDLP
jgi:formylglycine-generating enzyme required for sulfatase activity